MLEIRKTTRAALPRIPFERIARDILGPSYELSLVIAGDALSRAMNKKYRKKSYVPNVLSFPISKKEGEIFLNPRVAKREAKRYGVSFKERLVLLFAHGCLHLHGMQHGSKMERLEKKFVRIFA